MQRINHKLILGGILLLALALRILNINWDQGYHLHPDERAIVMYTTALQYPSSISVFLDPVHSPWNPHFFAYGSFPLYLLKISGDILGVFHAEFSTYGAINLVGRVISALADIGTLVVVYVMGKKLFNRTVGYVAAFFYSIAVLPIQLSHFYAVDTLLTFFLLATLLSLLSFYDAPSKKKAIGIGLLCGAALATKISATVIILPIVLALSADFILLVTKQPHKPRLWLPHLPRFVLRLGQDGLLIGITALVTFVMLEPYAFIAFPEFLQQTLQQSEMTKDAFVFPYTLQYVGKIPYVYELTNMFFWGLGPLLATICFLGTLYTCFLAVTQKHTERLAKEIILLVFFLAYFAIIGRFAIGFMRYSLPLYPLLALFGAVFIVHLLHLGITRYQPTRWQVGISASLFVLALLIWPISFVQIYTRDNPRTAATEWILTNIPPGKTIAVEHWDDSLPLTGQDQYNIETLALYDPDSPEKWHKLTLQLAQTDYLILASNRLYTPLQKLTDCEKLPPFRCYTQTAEYYQNLFAGKLGFRQVTAFTNYPTIPGLNLPIDDQSADESFQVYDHPKVIIFQKQ